MRWSGYGCEKAGYCTAGQWAGAGCRFQRIHSGRSSRPAVYDSVTGTLAPGRMTYGVVAVPPGSVINMPPLPAGLATALCGMGHQVSAPAISSSRDGWLHGSNECEAPPRLR